MAIINMKSAVLKWYFFTLAGPAVFNEFSYVYMKQLNFSPKEIGLTSFFGVMNIFTPLVLLVGDKFRARKAIFWVVTVISFGNFLLPLLPLAVPLPTCYAEYSISNHSNETKAMTEVVDKNIQLRVSSVFTRTKSGGQNVPFTSKLFFVMAVSRSLSTFLDGVALSLVSLATISYLDKDRASFGAYQMWQNIGTTTSVVGTAAISSIIRITICGNEDYGYFVGFIMAAIFVVLSVFSLPWMEFKYENDQTTNWSDLKSVFFNSHYVYVYTNNVYIGFCTAFQLFWEFWYLDGLEASPLIMGAAALIRRPAVAIFQFISCYVIRRFGDLYTVAIGLLLFSLSFFALSFVRVYWYVLAVDLFQAAAVSLSVSAFTVHFSKAGSKASSGVILGLSQMCFFCGLDAGSMIFGLLFEIMGTERTLLLYSLVTAFMLAILLCYVKFSKEANEYDKIPEDSDHDVDENDEDDIDDTLP